jgi:hydrogenase maturation protease
MRIVVCGIGNIERGDDAFGPNIVARLNEDDVLKKVDCGLHPENYLNKIMSYSPDLVIFLDTVSGNSDDCILLRNEEISRLGSVSVSTHSLPLSTMCEFLAESGVRDIFFLAVPARSYGHYTASVKDKADHIVTVLNNIDKKRGVCIIEIYEALSEQIR